MCHSLPLPDAAPVALGPVGALYQTPAIAVHDAITPAITQVNSADNGLDFGFALRFIYLTGIVLLLIKCLAEMGGIIYLAVRNPSRTINDHKVIITGRNHAPYSFMGWIFIGHPENYAYTELDYIVLHEAAHNARKHWLDLLILQVACIICWFHPLVWRYRRLLKCSTSMKQMPLPPATIAMPMVTFSYSRPY